MEPGLVAHRDRGGPRFVVGALQLHQDRVHLVAHTVHRGRHLVPCRPQLLDLYAHLSPPSRQIGQHASTCLLDLFEQGAAFPLRLDDDSVPLGGRLRQDALALGPRFVLGVGHQQLHLAHSLGRRCLRSRLELVDLLLRLPQHGRRALLRLADDPRRLLMGVAEDLRAVLTERGGQRRLVDDRVRRPLLGVGQRTAQLLLVFLERLNAAGDRLQIGPHLVGVVPTSDDGKGVPGDVARRDP